MRTDTCTNYNGQGSTNIALLNGTNSLTGTNTFSQVPIFTNSGPTIATNSGLGAGATASIAGSDVAHRITLTGGYGATATLATVTFSKPRASTNFCIVLSALGATGGALDYNDPLNVGSITTNGYTIFSQTADATPGTVQLMMTLTAWGP